jgi:hypothetical protein
MAAALAVMNVDFLSPMQLRYPNFEQFFEILQNMPQIFSACGYVRGELKD